jgi:DNA-binding response OmpR family regulator
MRKIAIVSDNADEIRFLLKGEYDVQIMPHGSPVHSGDLILIDVRGDDFSLCERLRAERRTSHTPILVLGEHSDPESRARAFTAGADGYVQKPLHENELFAQIRARLRNLKGPGGPLHCGNLSLDVDSQEAMLANQLLNISTLEFRIVHYFISNIGRLITRKALLDALWKDNQVSERTIDAHMAILRKKLGGFDHEFQTVYGSGYRLKRIQN